MQLRRSLQTIKPYIAGALKPGAIKLASNENPLGSSPRAIDAAADCLKTAYLYPDALADRLRDKLAPSFNVTPEQIILGNGSDEIILFVAGAYIEEGTNAVTSECTFSEYTFATTLFGGTMKYAPMENGKFQLSSILKCIDADTRLVFLCNPNNPTGTYFSETELTEFMKKVPGDILVVLDEAYHEYVGASDYPDTAKLIPTCGNLIILRTFSKIYGLAGMRIGYGISREETIQDLRKTKEPFNVNIIAQAAALAALDDKEFLEKSVSVNKAGKEYLYGQFDELGLLYYPTEANFICVKIGMNGKEAFEKIMELGVTIRPLLSFGLTDWIRVTIGTPEQNRKFISCLKEVLALRDGIATS